MTQLLPNQLWKSKSIWGGLIISAIGIANLLGYDVPVGIIITALGFLGISLRMAIADLFVDLEE